MIKNILKTCVLFCVTAILISCSFLEETHTGSIVFDFSEVRARAAQYSKKSQIEIQLTGDYTAKKIISVEDELICTFEEIPVDAVVQAEATLYYNSLSGLRKDLYTGKSKPVTIVEGENIVEIVLKKIVTVADDEAEYIVKHLQQNPDNDDYIVFESEVLTGKKLAQTNATAKSYIGFTACEITNKVINPDPDNPTIIEIKYDRNVHTLIYKGGDDGVTVPAEKEYRYGAKVEVDFTTSVTRAGYDFAGWKNSADGTIYKDSELMYFEMDDSDVVLLAQWVASSNTRYTVKHFKQNITDDDYTEVTEDREAKTGTSLALTSATAKSYTGFTVQPIEQQTIAVDNSTVVEIKYNRNTYTVTYDDSVANETIEVPDDTTAYRYGATVDIDFTTGSRTGYTFKNWTNMVTGDIYSADNSTSFEMGDDDVILYAQWEANTYNIIYHMNSGEWAEGYAAPQSYTFGESVNLPDADDIVLTGYGLTGWYTTNTFDTGTKLTEIAAGTTEAVEVYAQWTAGATTYKVHHLQQNLEDDNYTEVTEDLQTLAGTSDSMTNATAKSYTGFTAITPISQETISGDGSTEVTIKYNRNTYTVTYADGKDSVVIVPDYSPEDIPEALEYKYGATVTIASTKPRYTGYYFETWKDAAGQSYSSGDTFTIENDITLTAKWMATGVRYTVIHLIQKLDGTYEEAERTQPLQTTGLETLAEVQPFAGYEVLDFQQQIVQPDGSTVVEIKYDRKKFGLAFDENANDETVNNMATDSTEYLYEQNIVIPTEIPTRTGYRFIGWSIENPAISTTILYNAGDTGPAMSDSGLTLYAQWQEEEQSTGIDVGFGVDDTTLNVTISGTTATADEGYENYHWTVDSETQTSNERTLNLSGFTTPGVYDITLSAEQNGKTYNWAGQYIKN